MFSLLSNPWMTVKNGQRLAADRILRRLAPARCFCFKNLAGFHPRHVVRCRALAHQKRARI